MTIASTTSQVVYTGNAATTAFAIPFYFLLGTDLTLTSKTGTTTVSLVYNVDYTVSGAGSLTGGSVTLTTAPGASTTLTISRVSPVTQLTAYVQDDAFPAASHEKALDKLTMICQQLQTNINNAVLASTTQGEANTGSNLGSGLSVFKQKSVLDLQFRSISSPANGSVGMAIVSDRIEIDVLKVISQANTWNHEQSINYNIPTVSTGFDHGGWTSQVHNNVGTVNNDNMVALTGHAYHDTNHDNATGGIWGIATEAWTNNLGTVTAVGGEFSVIAQHAASSYTSVGVNSVFKNRADIATHPIAAVGDGSYYNQRSVALFISSQARPSGAGAAWANVGSGWNTAIKIGDPGYGSGLDWEGGNSGTTGAPASIRNFSTILDLTQSQRDLAGGIPWLFLWQTGLTYFGARFVPTITSGVIEIMAAVPAAAGAGYAVNDTGTLDYSLGASGTPATYRVTTVAAGAVTGVTMTGAGTGYFVNPSNACTVGGAQPGVGVGLRVNIQQVVGERIEFWRLSDPGDLSTGQRYGFCDLAYNRLNNLGGAFLKSFL